MWDLYNPGGKPTPRWVKVAVWLLFLSPIIAVLIANLTGHGGGLQNVPLN